MKSGRTTPTLEPARRRELESGERDVLERIARGEPLPDVLERIVALIEGVTEESLGSILLLDPDGLHVRHGSAPHLPDPFVRAIDGSEIGPNEGSCGTAAYRKERVVVEDIATHPYWAAYKALALPLGLRACWSSPILGTTGDVLGTFAIYYTEPRAPTDAELACVDVATHLASIAISRMRAEEALRTSEHQYRQIYEAVHDVVFHVAVDPNGDFRFSGVNPAFTRTTGLELSAVVGRRVEDVIPPDSIALVTSSYRRAIAERRTVFWEESSDYPSGRKFGDVSVTPVFDSTGRCTDLVGTVHDTTPHKLAAARIAEQAALLDKAHDAIVVLDLDDRVRYWNHGATRLFGLPHDEAIGRPFAELVETDPSVRHFLRERLLADGETTAEVRRRSRDGTLRVVESSATLLRDERGNPSAILLIDTDITERKSLEAQFHRVQRIEALGTLAGGIAHDFNNILTGILGHVRSASMALGSNDRARRAIDEIERGAWRAADLTRRILTFSREQESTQVPTDLRVPVAEAVALLEATIAPPTELRSEIAADVPIVLADPTAIHQVVMNLATNAAHAIGDRRGHIDVVLRASTIEVPRVLTVGTLKPGLHAVISVRDDGRGMNRATMERMFEPYFTTKGMVGTGLGLSVVHGIVANHGGALEVTSEVGSGSTVSVFLPAFPASATG